MCSYCLLLVCLVAGSAYGQDAATALLRDQNQCNSRILRSKGIRRLDYQDEAGQSQYLLPRQNFYRDGGQAKVVFPDDKLSVEPPAGQDSIRIPGCFVLNARDVHVYKDLQTLTAEFEMRLGAIPSSNTLVRDWPKPLPCQQDGINNKCPCGIKDSCVYCDFCQNLNVHVPGGVQANQTDPKFGLTRKIEIIPKDGGDTCACNIKAGRYDIKAEVCTPSAEEMREFLPEAVLSLVDEANNGGSGGGGPAPASEFTLYTILSLYEDRFSVPTGVPDAVAQRLVEERKAASLVGCHFVITDVVL